MAFVVPLFALAIIVRYAWLLWCLLRGRGPDEPPASTIGSGL